MVNHVTAHLKSTGEEVWEAESHLCSTIRFGADYATVATANIAEQGAGSREEKQQENEAASACLRCQVVATKGKD